MTMPAKKTTAKKLSPRTIANHQAAARKKARDAEAAMQNALAPIVHPTPPVADEHPTLGGQAPALMPAFENPPFSSDEFNDIEEEAWPDYSPGGESPDMPVLINTAPLEAVQPEVVAPSPTDASQARQRDAETLGEGEPADPDELPPLIHGGDEAAQVVLNLIDGLEYLFKKAKGLKMHDKPILMRRVKAARELINLLQRQ